MRTCREKYDCVFIGGVLWPLCAGGGVAHCRSIAICSDAYTDSLLWLLLGVLGEAR